MIETTTVGLIQETQCQWFEPKRLRALLLTVDGAGSGIDADLLDGYEASAFPRLAVSNTFTGTITASAFVARGASAGISFFNRDTDTAAGQWYSPAAGDLRLYNSASSSDRLRIDTSGNFYIVAGTIKTLLNVAWDLGAYTAVAPAATGYVTVKISGTTIKLLAST